MKFENLKVGMLTTAGLVIRIIEAGEDRFWGDEKSIMFIDLNDAYWGQAARSVSDDEEFLIIHERGTEEYKREMQRLIEERFKYIHDAQNDVDLLRAYKE